ncbi:MAG: virulence factor, partial [Hyphomicrobiales bacterium]
EWRRADPIAVGDDLEAEVAAAVAKIEAEYDKDRLIALVQNSGREPSASS